MERQKIIEEIESVRQLIDNGDSNNALPVLLELKKKIIDTRFYPLLDSILPLLINILEKEKDYTELSLLYMLRNSKYINSTDKDTRFCEFSEFVNRAPEIQVTIPPQYVNIVPLCSTFRYLLNYDNNLHLICDLVSYFSQPIHVNDISIEFISNNGQSVHTISLGDMNLHSSKCVRKKVDYDISPTTVYEKVNAVIYIVGNLTIRIEKEFNADINIDSLQNSIKGQQIQKNKNSHDKSPFLFEWQLFDENLYPIADQVVEIGSPIIAEMTITNNIDCNVIISNITSLSTEIIKSNFDASKISENSKDSENSEEQKTEDSENSDLPIELYPGESYCFRSLIKEECNANFTVDYKTELSGDPRIFEFSIGHFKQFDRLLKMKFNSPPFAVKGKPFDTTLSIEFNDDKLPYVQIFIDVVMPTTFFAKCQSRKSVYLFNGQKKEIKFTFVPLAVGSLTLPQIYINNLSIKESKARIFMVPIVVTY